jgi:hypothetical protein
MKPLDDNMKKWKIALIGLASLIVLNLLMPTKIQNPVEGCGRESYNGKLCPFQNNIAE